MRPLLALLVLTFSLVTTELAGAPSQATKFGIGVLAGGSKLRGDIESTNMAFTSGLLLRYSPVSFFAFSANATYGNLTSGVNAVKTNIINTGLSGTFFLLPNKRFRPFISAGLSNFRYQVKDGTGALMTDASGSPLEKWQQALQFGGGLELFVGRNMALNTIADYVFAPVDDLDGIVSGSKDGYLRGLFGVVFYFGGGKHKDTYRTNTYEYKVGMSFDEARADDERTTTGTGASLTKNEVFSDGIYFERGGTQILEKSRWHLVKIYRFLEDNPEEVLELRPFGDNKVTDERVREFVLARALSVKKYLINLGVQADRIIIHAN